MVKKEENKFQDLLEKIETMSVRELSDFVKLLEERFGVSATSPVSIPQGAMPAQAPSTPTEEKTSFNVVLREAGSSKIQVIKVVKEITGRGLGEAKNLIEKTPSVIKEGVKKEEAEELKKKLEAAGAVIAIE